MMTRNCSKTIEFEKIQVILSIICLVIVDSSAAKDQRSYRSTFVDHIKPDDKKNPANVLLNALAISRVSSQQPSL